VARAEQRQLAKCAAISHLRCGQEITKCGFAVGNSERTKAIHLGEQNIGANLSCCQRLQQMDRLLQIARARTPIHQKNSQCHLRLAILLRRCETQPMQALVELTALMQDSAQCVLRFGITRLRK